MNEKLQEKLSKLKRYSAYRERCSSEIRSKMFQLGVSIKDQPKLLSLLEKEGFVDDERYANLYTRSKFMQNQWGREKIRVMLMQKGIDSVLIDQSFKEIDANTYTQVLNDLMQKKYDEIKGNGSEFEVRMKLSRYAKQRGYEAELFVPIIEKMLE